VRQPPGLERSGDHGRHLRGNCLSRLFATPALGFTGLLPIAVCLQAVIFGPADLYQGWKPGVAIVVVGFILGAVAAWRRSIIPGIIADAILDFLSSLAPH